MSILKRRMFQGAEKNLAKVLILWQNGCVWRTPAVVRFRSPCPASPFLMDQDSLKKEKSLRYSVRNGVFASMMNGFTLDYLTPFLLLLGGTI